METPILLITFNRPELTRQVFDVIKIYRPTRLFISSDGPRVNNVLDNIKVEETRRIFEDIDWDCKVIKLYQTTNLGCMVAVTSAISWFFENVSEGIILEDDCLPSYNTFAFLEKGLKAFRNNPNIGMISASNLIDYKFKDDKLNGFSKYINIWGWATWKHVWDLHSENLKIISNSIFLIKKHKNNTLFENLFWFELFKFTINKKSTWDFQLQCTFFINNLFSVYPIENTILNIGFDASATHTIKYVPDYILRSKPKNNNINCHHLNMKIDLNSERDRFLIKTIWSFSPFTIIKLKFRNFVKYYK